MPQPTAPRRDGPGNEVDGEVVGHTANPKPISKALASRRSCGLGGGSASDHQHLDDQVKSGGLSHLGGRKAHSGAEA